VSTEVAARFYLDGRPSVEETFGRLARIISGWPQATGEWRGFKVTEGGRDNVVTKSEGVLSTEELVARAAGRAGDERLASARTSFRCWRFRDGEATPGHVVLLLEVWGETFARGMGQDLRLSGSAGLTIVNAGPFCAVVEAEDRGRARAVNERVEENLEAVTGLWLEAIDAVRPRSMKVFTGECLFLPFNAHVVYHRDDAEVVADLHVIGEAWERGVPAQGAPPLRRHDPQAHAPTFHHGRPDEMRERLWRGLRERVSRIARATPAMVERVRTSGRFDTYAMPVGTAVLDYPHPLNAFVDRFYLEILDEVTPAVRP